jgi:CubicO group peptidase (beta-lactamase class C family)
VSCAVTCALCAAASAEEAKKASGVEVVPAEEAGMSAEKLALVAPALQKIIDEGKAAGAVAIAARRGKVVLFTALGKQDIASGAAMTPDSIFRIYSMTKPITSVAVMMLVEEGKLALDDPVSKHIPQLAGMKVYVSGEGDELKLEDAKREPTVRDLLRHTSGLTYGFFGNTEVDEQYRDANLLDNSGTLADMIEKLAKLPLVNQPGARFNYSVSTDVLARIVEVVSGQSFDKFLAERIFEPLGMSDTAFFVPEEKRDRFTACYGPGPDGKLTINDDPKSSRYLTNPRFLSGGGGLVSTAHDYLRFCQMLLNRGELDGKRLLEASTVDEMTKNQLSDEAYPVDVGGKRPGVGFGLGFSVIVEKTAFTGASHIGEFGWGGAASTHFWISPKDELAVVVLTQLMPFDFQMENAAKPLIYDAIEE